MIKSKNQNQMIDSLLDYVKFIYDEEKERTNYLEKKVNILLVFFGGGIFGLLIKFPDELFTGFISKNQIFGFLIILIFFVALVLLIISAVFILLVYKVRMFERLCNPEELSLKADSINDENILKSLIIADYVVATNRNHLINEKKAKHLSYAINCFLYGLILFTLCLVIANIFQLI